ncbi:MAG: hypothetical protein HZB83_03325 [Deltaproteobacteria bacterium]|nr:hypothetical protein [Deltaproteobacteria bacterium]
MDGITVAEYVAEGSIYDVEAVGVEYGRVVEEVRNSSRILKLGAVEEIAVLTHGKDVILRTVTPEYYIAFVVSNGNIGKARYMLKTAAKRVGKEL